jgi:hypothetical protein
MTCLDGTRDLCMICTANTSNMIEGNGNSKELTKGERKRDLTGNRRLGRQQRDRVVADKRKSCSRDVSATDSSSGRWSPAASAARAGDHHPFNVPPIAIPASGKSHNCTTLVAAPATRSSVERNHSHAAAGEDSILVPRLVVQEADCRGGAVGRRGDEVVLRGGGKTRWRRHPSARPDARGTQVEWIRWSARSRRKMCCWRWVGGSAAH